jgi:large subunit ribosomal protein L5e
MYDVTNLPLCCRYNLKKLTYEQRKASLVERLNALNSSAGADDDDEEEDDE